MALNGGKLPSGSTIMPLTMADQPIPASSPWPIPPVLSLISGAIILSLAAVPIYRSLASRFWPTVPGTVASTQVLRNNSREKQTRNRPFYYTVRYQYTVDGMEYTSGRSYFAVFHSDDIARSGFASYADTQAAIDQEYPPDQALVVYHHPSNPAVSVLNPTLHPKTYLVIGLMSGLFLYGVYGVAQWARGS